MTSQKIFYTFQSLLKNLTLLPAEKFGNINLSADSFTKNNLDFRTEIYFMEK